MHTTAVTLLGLLASVQAVAIPAAPQPAKRLRFPISRRDTNAEILSKRDLKTSLNFNAYWNADITIGDQKSTVLLDTGSADLWLIGSDAPDSQKQGKHVIDCSNTGGQEMEGQTFGLGYGTGESGPIGGKMYTGKVCLGGNVCINDMSFGLASTGSIPMDGILGLGFWGGNSVRPDPQLTFMEKLQITEKLDNPIMAFHAHSNNQDSYVEFGSVDEKCYKGQLQTIQAEGGRNGHDAKYAYSWSVEGMSYWSNNQKLADFDTVFDTGGPMSSGPLDAVRAYYAQIQGAKDVNGDGSSWQVPCNANMPDLTWKFPGGATASIPGSRLLLEASDDDLKDGSKTCTSWFVKENSDNRSVIGQPFFNEYVVIFNQKDATISFAEKA